VTGGRGKKCTEPERFYLERIIGLSTGLGATQYDRILPNDKAKHLQN